MKHLDWNTVSAAERRTALARPNAGLREDVFRQAAVVISAVRAEGDAAVRRFTRQFGGPSIDDLRVSPAELRAARAALSGGQIAALERAIANVARFHEAQRPA